MSLLTLIATAALSQSGPSIRTFVQDNLRDFSFQTRNISADQRELRKINRDFGQAYRFDTTRFTYKEPMMLRGEATVEDQSVVYIINGTTRRYRIPRAGLNSREDLSKDPGKRQTSLDFGILTPSLFNNFLTAKFVREDSRTGAAVFDLTYVPALRDATRHRVWVDKEKGITIRREWYSRFDGGRLQATFFYEDPVRVSGVWIPQRMRVVNADGRQAGVTAYERITANTGVSDALFAVN
ncbi:MAG: outer membrane lipoprotein-sorting protein [Fimbriimonadaceae bacterium]|nr:outer membrane lipoprotein-sorting protein [Fimbriimonadaceae bacterium]